MNKSIYNNAISCIFFLLVICTSSCTTSCKIYSLQEGVYNLEEYNAKLAQWKARDSILLKVVVPQNWNKSRLHKYCGYRKHLYIKTSKKNHIRIHEALISFTKDRI